MLNRIEGVDRVVQRRRGGVHAAKFAEVAHIRAVGIQREQSLDRPSRLRRIELCRCGEAHDERFLWIDGHPVVIKSKRISREYTVARGIVDANVMRRVTEGMSESPGACAKGHCLIICNRANSRL